MRPTTRPTQSWAQPCDTCITGVKNFAEVSPKLWRGSQPEKEGFRNLERAGVKTVISLRADPDDYDNFSKLGGTQFKYLRVPMHARDPDQAQLVVLMKVIEKALRDPNSWPVFIHCAEGKDRTGYSVATYRMVFEGTPSSDAVHEMFDFRFNTIWFRNPGFLESLDIKKIKTLMQLAP